MKKLQNDFDKILDLLNKAQNKYELDLAIHYVLGLIEKSQDIVGDFACVSKEILELFREKIFNLVFAKGDITDRAYLCLYILFKNTDVIDRFDKIETIATTSLFLDGVSDNENVMLIELGALAKILNGKAEEGLEFYIQNIMLIDIHALEAQKNIEFMLNFFNLLKPDFDFFAKNLKFVLIEKFHTLSYKQKRSVFNWQLHFFWNLKHYFNHRGWLDFYPIWKEILYQELDYTSSEKIDFALYLQFFIYHMCGNNFASQDEWRVFNEEITLVASKAYENFAKQFLLPVSEVNRTGVIGILRDRLVENSPYKVEYSFLKTLLSNEEFRKSYKVKIYLMSLLEKSDNDKLVLKSYEDLGIEVIDVVAEQNKAVYYNSHLAKALVLRERLLQDKVEVLVSPNNGYGISDFLFATRASQKQIFWSHGNFVYNTPFIDAKITHICGNKNHIVHQGYDFIGVPVKMDDYFYNPEVNMEIVKQVRAHYPKDMCILGNMGRLVKIDNLQYLENIGKIMQQNPNTIFLACGGGNVDEIRNKIRKIDSKLLERFYFPGFVDSTLYGHIIDIWLDSFPMEQGESRIEFSAKGKPSLVLSKESREQRESRLGEFFDENQDVFLMKIDQTEISIDEMKSFVCKEDSFVAFDENDYIEKAGKIIAMPEMVLAHKMKLQNLLKEVNDYLREQKGKKAFLEIL